MTNSTQTPLFIEGTQFLSAIEGVTGNNFDVDLPNDPMIREDLLGPLQSFNLGNVPILQPGERFGFAFVVSADENGVSGSSKLLQNMNQRLGHVEVTWCAHMGERGVLRSDDIKYAPSVSGGNTAHATEGKPERQKLECVCSTYPSSNIHVGSRFPLSIGCINHTDKSLAFRLEVLPRENPSGTCVPGDSSCGLDMELPFSTFHIEPREMLECSCQVTALRGGLQGLGEVRAVSADDPATILWSSNDLVHVLVLP